jgi:hypothetical protein
MPNRTPAAHAGHDLLLVAAQAAGDLEGPDRTTAESVIASCADCRELAADLRVIALATAALPTPARPRDFTLRPEDAARLRPQGWRRFVAAMGPGRLDLLLRPLAPTLMTLGLVGLLVSGLPLVLGGMAGAASAPAPDAFRAAGASAAASAAAGQPAASAAPAASAPNEAASITRASPAASVPAKGVFGGAEASPSRIADTAAEPSPVTRQVTPAPELSVPTGPTASEQPDLRSMLAPLSAVALVLGLVLFGLRRVLLSTPRH